MRPLAAGADLASGQGCGWVPHGCIHLRLSEQPRIQAEQHRSGCTAAGATFREALCAPAGRANNWGSRAADAGSRLALIATDYCLLSPAQPIFYVFCQLMLCRLCGGVWKRDWYRGDMSHVWGSPVTRASRVARRHLSHHAISSTDDTPTAAPRIVTAASNTQQGSEKASHFFHFRRTHSFVWQRLKCAQGGF